MKILVTGSNGQLGKTLKENYKTSKGVEFVFTSRETLDITNDEEVNAFFKEHEFEYCINCAAYTNVEKAEEEPNQAFLVNAEAVKNLALACKTRNTVLIHISTDYVFDGKKRIPYNETDIPHPLNVYGASKLRGENYIKTILNRFFIIRTSWLYSEYGNNFVKRMLHLGCNNKELRVISDQIGSPTYAKDLEEVILEIINTKNNQYGLYHYCNQGAISWFDFAKAIFNFKNLTPQVTPVSTSSYTTKAKRPLYSVLSQSKLSNCINLSKRSILSSLHRCLQNI